MRRSEISGEQIAKWARSFSQISPCSITPIAELLMDMFKDLKMPFEPTYIDYTGVHRP